MPLAAPVTTATLPESENSVRFSNWFARKISLDSLPPVLAPSKTTFAHELLFEGAYYSPLDGNQQERFGRLVPDQDNAQPARTVRSHDQNFFNVRRAAGASDQSQIGSAHQLGIPANNLESAA